MKKDYKLLKRYIQDGDNLLLKVQIEHKMLTFDEYFKIVREEIIDKNNRKEASNKDIYKDAILFNEICENEGKEEFKISYKINKKNRYSFW